MTAKLGIVGIRSCLAARKNNKTIFFRSPSSTQKWKAINYYASCRGNEEKAEVAFAQCENIQVDARVAAVVKNVIASDFKFSLSAIWKMQGMFSAKG